MIKFNAFCPKCQGLIYVDKNEDATICPKCQGAIAVEDATEAFTLTVSKYNGVCPRCESLVFANIKEKADICPTCEKAYLVEKAIGLYKEIFCADIGVTTDKSTPKSSPLSDFKIVNGVLQEYLGNGGDVVIPKGVTEIAENAFMDYGAASIYSIYIPEGVTKTGEASFLGCDELEKVYIPSTLTDISPLTFSYCDIQCIKLSPSNPRYKLISGCLVDVKERSIIAASHGATIPIDADIEHISDGAFAGAHWLSGMLVIPDGVKTIGYEAFLGAGNITGVTIPESVTRIEEEAFSDTDLLEKIVFENKNGWTYNGCEIEIPELTDFDTVDKFLGKYGFKYPLIRKD